MKKKGMVHFHPVLAYCQSTDYQLFYVLGHGLYAANMAKWLWYTGQSLPGCTKSEGRGQHKKYKKAPKPCEVMCVCSKSPTCFSHMVCVMHVYSGTYSQSGEVWNRLSVLPCPFSVLLLQIPLTICLPSTTWISPPKCWPCCHPFHTPLSISAIPCSFSPPPIIALLSVHHLRALGGSFV